MWEQWMEDSQFEGCLDVSALAYISNEQAQKATS